VPATAGGREHPPRRRPPPGACDCHIHVFDPRFPSRPDAAFAPPVATVDAYRRVQQRLGLERVVVVQSLLYGADNRCLLDALSTLGAQARGIAVVDADVTAHELQQLHAAGVRAVRFLMVPGGVLSWESLPEVAARVHEFGWHLNVQMDGRLLPERALLLRSLPGNLIIDHVGMFVDPVAPGHPGFRALLRMLDSGRVWVKLSAPYAGGRTGPPPYREVGVLARRLVKAAPQRMLWGSDWPHVFSTAVRHQVAEDDAMLLDLLLDWAEDEHLRHAILVDNPAALFGF
jgi:D-galactarolactone isomerase